ncbi:BTAD domain-containing putative transcriptional regulator [Streptomyces sp. NPDC058045]|uniref:AfsR/SARP family transcriptional regulator n=1 Tax=Streptomyces sp. NPDC058045 TaxID=3346311 RepID=UPI0036E715A4
MVAIGNGRLRFCVLGPMRAWNDGAEATLGPSRQQAVLAALVLRPHITRSIPDLLAAVWGGDPPASGRNVVSVYMYRLRAALRAVGATDEVIRGSRGGYQFTGDAEVDATLLDELLEQARTAEQLTDAEALLTKATALFIGEPLAGLPGPHAAAERQRLRDRSLTAWRALAELWLRQQRPTEAVDLLTRLVAENPYDEPMVALLMRAHHCGGWATDALRDYRDLRERMVGDLGVEPGSELRALHQAVLRQDHAAIGGRAVAMVAGQRVRNELPPDIPQLGGRDAEVEALRAYLSTNTSDAPRVVAVIGIAGVGKSALVVHIAHLLASSFPSGALFLDLHGHTPGREPLDSADGLHRLLRAVGVDERDIPDDLDERAALWRAATADAKLLLVLDNAASREQIRLLLPGGAGCRVLVTSRARLADLDPDEQVTLRALPEASASALLGGLVGQDRADAEPDAVLEVARLCGGLPLAVRIAAARLRNRPEWTFGHLAGKLADGRRRLTELGVGDRTVAAAFALSYSRLPAAEQRVFRLLGEVPGIAPDRYSVAVLAQIRPETAERLLENIVDASLLDAVSIDRYRLHDLAADYTRQLAEAQPEPDAPGRLLRYRLTAVEAATALLTGAGRDVPDDVPFRDMESAAEWFVNSRIGLAEAVDHAARTGHADTAADIAVAAARPYAMRSWFGDILRMHEVALAASTDRHRSLKLLVGLANVHGLRGAYQQGWDCFDRAHVLAEELRLPYYTAVALGGMGACAVSLGRYRQAAGHLGAALDVAERHGLTQLTGGVLANLGVLNGKLGRHDLALDHMRAAVAVAVRRQDPLEQTRSTCELGVLLCDIGATEEAAAVLNETLDLARRTGDNVSRALALAHLGSVAHQNGDLDTAIARQTSALDAVDADAVDTVVEIRNRLGDTCLAAGRTTEAREQYRTTIELTDKAPNPNARAHALGGLAQCGRD